MSDPQAKATKGLWARCLDHLPSRRATLRWFRVLVSAQPSFADYILLFAGVVCAIGAGVPFPLLGIIFGDLINNINSANCNDTTTGNNAHLSHAVRTRVLEIIYVTIANFVLIYAYTTCWSLFGERLVRRLRKNYFQSLIKQDLTYFDQLGAGAGDVTSRLVSDIETVQTGTSEKVGIFIGSASYFVAAYIVAFLKAPKIAGILVSVLPAYALMAVIGGHFITKYAKRMAANVDAATSVASSSLSNMQLVHAFGAQRRLVDLFAMHLSKTNKDGLKKALSHAIQLGLLYFIAYCSNALAFWEGSREIAPAAEGGHSSVSVGGVYTVIFVLLDASYIVSQVAPFLHIFHAAGEASERLEQTTERISKIDGTNNEGLTDFSLSQQDVNFENVSFAYPSRPDLPALHDISLRFPAGKSTAIVGPSGGGKSTVTALLERLYDPDTGAITVGNVNMRELNVRNLRSKMGFVEQNAPLLDRSILENVAYGLAGSSQFNETIRSAAVNFKLSQLAEQIRSGEPEDRAIGALEGEVRAIVNKVRDALDVAHATEFIQRLPHGIGTRVGSSGSQVSGGQRQRIVLARALIREPELLIFDEATASLDATSEKLIQSAIAIASQGKTVVTVAHRLSTIQNADNIIVIQGGRIVEQGDHVSLLKLDGEYAKMVSVQNVGSNDDEELAIKEEISDGEKGLSDSGVLEKTVSSSGSSSTAEPVHDVSEPEKADTTRSSIVPTRSSEFPQKGKQGLFSVLRPIWAYILVGLIMSVIVGGSYAAEAVLFGQTVGRLSTCNTRERILSTGRLFGLLFFLLGIIEFTAVIANGSSFGLGAAKTLLRVRKSTFGSLLRQSIQWHNAESRTPGELLSVITGDAAALSALTGSTIGIIVSTAVNLVAGIILAHIIAWKIAIVLLACMPILLATGFMRLRILGKFHERHQKAFSKATSITLEAVENIRMVAALSLEDSIYLEFEDSLRSPYRETLKAILHSSVWLSLAFSIPNLVYALGYYWGSKQILSGNYSQTQFFTVLPALLFSAQSCGQMFALAPDFSKARSATKHVLDLINIDPEAEVYQRQKAKDPEKALSASTQAASEKQAPVLGLEFQDVHFAYPTRPDHEVLRGLDLAVAPGQFCALVGPSGQGKSTILNLIERFYEPNRGSVIIDHSNITLKTSTEFRDRIALVPQSSVLFNGTIAFNLGLGARPSETATQADLEHACRLAGVHDLITSLKDGYDTLITSNSQFSGGQRQRLCIARALVRKPALLLLDESTSALDTESERHIQESLERVRREAGVTIVAIAHRLNTIMGADKIFWIEQGRCAYSGTHRELLESCSGYKESVGHQKL